MCTFSCRCLSLLLLTASLSANAPAANTTPSSKSAPTSNTPAQPPAQTPAATGNLRSDRSDQLRPGRRSRLSRQGRRTCHPRGVGTSRSQPAARVRLQSGHRHGPRRDRARRCLDRLPRRKLRSHLRRTHFHRRRSSDDDDARQRHCNPARSTPVRWRAVQPAYSCGQRLQPLRGTYLCAHQQLPGRHDHRPPG